MIYFVDFFRRSSAVEYSIRRDVQDKRNGMKITRKMTYSFNTSTEDKVICLPLFAPFSLTVKVNLTKIE